jgi:hypothetical protein
MKSRSGTRRGRLAAAKEVISSPACIAVAILAAFAYYLLFFSAIKYGSKGVFLLSVPDYLLYSLIGTASALLAVSAFAVLGSFRVRMAASEDVVSVLASSCGCLIAGCGCYSPIVASALYAVGLGTIQVSGVLSALADYQVWLVAIFALVNVALIYHQLGFIARMGSGAA